MEPSTILCRPEYLEAARKIIDDAEIKTIGELQDYLLTFPQVKYGYHVYGFSDATISTRLWMQGHTFFHGLYPDDPIKTVAFNDDDLIQKHIKHVLSQINKHKDILCFCRMPTYYEYYDDGVKSLRTRLIFGRITDLQSAYLKVHGFMNNIPDDINLLIEGIELNY